MARLITESLNNAIKALANLTPASGKGLTFSGADTAVVFDTHPGWVVGKYYATFLGSHTSAAPNAVDELYVYPFFVPKALTLASLAIRVNTGGAGSAVKMAIWANSGAGKPTGAPLAVNNTGAATTAAGTTTLAAAGSIPVGWHWAGQKFTGTLPVVLGLGTTTQVISPFLGRGTLSNSSFSGFSTTTGAAYASDMPTLTGAETWTDVVAGGPAIVYLVP